MPSPLGRDSAGAVRLLLVGRRRAGPAAGRSREQPGRHRALYRMHHLPVWLGWVGLGRWSIKPDHVMAKKITCLVSRWIRAILGSGSMLAAAATDKKKRPSAGDFSAEGWVSRWRGGAAPADGAGRANKCRAGSVGSASGVETPRSDRIAWGFPGTPAPGRHPRSPRRRTVPNGTPPCPPARQIPAPARSRSPTT